jgi:hypothetical protein
MIQANELRIGNWVKGIGHNVIWLIEGVEKGFIFSSNNWRIVESFEPIPLTEEWLLKFGFEKIKYNSEETGYGVDYVLTKYDEHGFGFTLEYCEDFSICILGQKDDVGISPNLNVLRNVHQLQNLYFALTGEELTIKN